MYKTVLDCPYPQDERRGLRAIPTNLLHSKAVQPGHRTRPTWHEPMEIDSSFRLMTSQIKNTSSGIWGFPYFRLRGTMVQGYTVQNTHVQGSSAYKTPCHCTHIITLKSLTVALVPRATKSENSPNRYTKFSHTELKFCGQDPPLMNSMRQGSLHEDFQNI